MNTCIDYIWNSDFILFNQATDWTYFACSVSKSGLKKYFDGDETAPVINTISEMTIESLKNEGVFSFHDIFFIRNIPVIILHNSNYKNYLSSISIVADLYINDKLVDSFEGDNFESVINSLVIKNIRYTCRKLTVDVLKLEKEFLNHLEYKVFVYFDFFSGLFKKEESLKECISSDFLPLFKGGYLSELIINHLDSNYQNYIIISLHNIMDVVGNISRENQRFSMSTKNEKNDIYFDIYDVESINKNLYFLREKF